MKVKFKRIYKDYSIGDIVDIDSKEELDYLINTETIDVLEDFESSEIEEKSNKKGKTKK